MGAPPPIKVIFPGSDTPGLEQPRVSGVGSLGREDKRAEFNPAAVSPDRTINPFQGGKRYVQDETGRVVTETIGPGGEVLHDGKPVRQAPLRQFPERSEFSARLKTAEENAEEALRARIANAKTPELSIIFDEQLQRLSITNPALAILLRDDYDAIRRIAVKTAQQGGRGVQNREFERTPDGPEGKLKQIDLFIHNCTTNPEYSVSYLKDRKPRIDTYYEENRTAWVTAGSPPLNKYDRQYPVMFSREADERDIIARYIDAAKIKGNWAMAWNVASQHINHVQSRQN